MSLVVTQEGAGRLWLQIWGITSIGYPFCHLYASAHTPAHTDTEAIYGGIELVAGGYAPIAMTSPATNWTVAPIAPGAQASYVTLNWALTSAANIYGYWLSDQTNTYSLWGELFSVVYTFPAVGGVFQLTLPPTLTSTPSVGGVPCP